MRRIQRDSKYEGVVKSLTTGEQPVFREIWRLMIFAAFLGYRLNLRAPLESTDSGKAIPPNYFEGNPIFRGLLFMLGIVETNNTACLSASEESEDALASIFEEYANGGLRYLNEEIGEATDPFRRILDLSLRFGVPTNEQLSPNLNDLI